jgi:hypothetical protein
VASANGDDVAVEGAVFIAGRKVEDDGTILGVEEDHEIEGVRIGCQRLVVPIKRASPIDDLADFAGRLGEHLLKHQVIVDRWHAPDHRFDSATLDSAIGKLLR